MHFGLFERFQWNVYTSVSALTVIHRELLELFLVYITILRLIRYLDTRKYEQTSLPEINSAQTNSKAMFFFIGVIVL